MDIVGFNPLFAGLTLKVDLGSLKVPRLGVSIPYLRG